MYENLNIRYTNRLDSILSICLAYAISDHGTKSINKRVKNQREKENQDNKKGQEKTYTCYFLKNKEYERQNRVIKNNTLYLFSFS